MYQIYGSENSPYSIKVRSYARYLGINHKWIVRSASTQAAFSKVAKLPLVPAVRLPNGNGIQDSTPIMELFDTLPAIDTSGSSTTNTTHPPGDLRFLSELLEEYGDEWLNKQMFHYRWARPIDQRIVSLRLASEMLTGGGSERSSDDSGSGDEMLMQMSDQVRDRMSGRGFAVGSNKITAPMLESTFQESMDLLEKHLKDRNFLFGSRPSFGDFGMGAQVYQALLDPTAGAHLLAHAPRVVEWCTSLLAPSTTLKDTGKWERWETLATTLTPLLKNHVGRIFLKWSHANSICIVGKLKECVVDLPCGTWKNVVGGPQKYQYKSLQVLRSKYAKVRNEKLDKLMAETNCLEVLSIPSWAVSGEESESERRSKL